MNCISNPENASGTINLILLQFSFLIRRTQFFHHSYKYSYTFQLLTPSKLCCIHTDGPFIVILCNRTTPFSSQLWQFLLFCGAIELPYPSQGRVPLHHLHPLDLHHLLALLSFSWSLNLSIFFEKIFALYQKAMTLSLIYLNWEVLSPWDMTS